MALTERYVSTTGAGAHDGTSEANAYSWDEMVTAINGGAHAGYRYNVKTGTYSRSAATSLSGDGSTTSPCIIRGYYSTIGDLVAQGRGSNGRLNLTNFPVIAYDPTYSLGGAGADRVIFETLKITGNVAGYLVACGLASLMFRCYVENASTNGSAGGIFNGSTRSTLIDCDVNMSGGSGTAYAISCAASDRVIGCRIINAPSHGIVCTGDNIVLAHLVLESLGGDAVRFTSTTTSHIPPLCLNITAYNAAGDLISIADAAYSYPLIVVNCHLTEAGAYAVKNEGSGSRNVAVIAAFNRTRDNTSGVFSGFDDWAAGTSYNHVTTDSGNHTTDYIDAPNGDLELISTAAGYAAGMIPHQDIGAIQHEDPAGGGGSGLLLHGKVG